MAKSRASERQMNGTYLFIDMDFTVDKINGYDNVIVNDQAVQLANVDIAGVDKFNSNDRVLYFSLTKPALDTILNIYSDAARTLLVASVTISGGTSGTSLALVEENSSGLSGKADINYSTDDTDIQLLWADGSEYAPYQTILKASTEATANDKIGLISGVYNESRAAKALKFYGMGTVVITLANFLSQNGDYAYNCRFTGNMTTTITRYFNNCYFDNLNGSLRGTSFYFCLFESCINIITVTSTVANCVFINCTSTGVTISSFSRNIMKGCDNFSFNATMPSGNYNCLVGNIKIATIARDLVWIQTNTATNQNSISDDPLFNNETINDYTLQLASPCINVGGLVGTKKMHVGAKNPAFAYSATTMFNNAVSATNCILVLSKIKQEQFSKAISSAQPANNQMYLNLSASAVDNYYNGLKLVVVSATTGVGEERTITSYVGSTKIVTFDSDLIHSFDAFYSIELEIETEVIDIGAVKNSDILNLFAKFFADTIYGNDSKGTVEIKIGTTLVEIGAASYEDFIFNSLMYVGEMPFPFRYIQLKFKTRVIV